MTSDQHTPAMKPVLVLGIGNILLHDEGVGVHAVGELTKMSLPPFVEAVDGGTAGADLLDIIADRAKVIIIDAAHTSEEAGTIMRMTPDDLDACDSGLSLHEFGVVETLRMARCLGCAPREVVIIAVQPSDISPGIGLSGDIARVMPAVLGLVRHEVDLWAESPVTARVRMA